MTTTADGAFAFGCISSPGFYLLSLARKGFGTQRYIVNAATLADADPLEVALIPGDGTLFGAVTGPDGPVGAATVSITDGTVSLSTSTVSPGGQGTAGQLDRRRPVHPRQLPGHRLGPRARHQQPTGRTAGQGPQGREPHPAARRGRDLRNRVGHR